MKIHVLPGDALLESFKAAEIEGEIVICRECLVEGDVRSESLEEFWRLRADFIGNTYGDDRDSYRRKVISEFERLQNSTRDDEIFLWFEYELFCQTNMWFCLFLLQNSPAAIYRIAPAVRAENEVWKGFGKLSKEKLKECFDRKTRFAGEDILLGAQLWDAYQNNDPQALMKLSETESNCFPLLKEVCKAETERHFRPQNTLKSLISQGETSFAKLFEQFNETEGVYGFADLQVKNIYNRIIK
jgi:hypothetical protein